MSHYYRSGKIYDSSDSSLDPETSKYQKNKHDSSGSSYPDFSDLCGDQKRIYNDSPDKSYNSDDSDDSSDSDLSEKPCQGCKRKCTHCDLCKSCKCRQCADHSISSILSSLGPSSSSDNSESSSKYDRLKDLVADHVPKRGKFYESRQKLKDSKPSKPSKPSTIELSSAPQSSVPSQSSSSTRGKKFVVTWGSKEGHQWSEYNTDLESIHINGKNGPVLHLYRGCTYFFCISQNDTNPESNHCFILTNSPIGGPNSRSIVGGFAPVSKGCVCLKVDKRTPRYFFYQCSKHEFEGGLVIVHDK
jgi:hypothetical protein